MRCEALGADLTVDWEHSVYICGRTKLSGPFVPSKRWRRDGEGKTGFK